MNLKLQYFTAYFKEIVICINTLFYGLEEIGIYPSQFQMLVYKSTLMSVTHTCTIYTFINKSRKDLLEKIPICQEINKRVQLNAFLYVRSVYHGFPRYQIY